MIIASSYMEPLHEPEVMRELVDRLCVKLVELREVVDFDVIAFRGMSGAAVCYPIQYKTGIPIINVRKPSEPSHGCGVEGPIGLEINRYIIVDDLIDTGVTIQSIIDALETRNIAAEKCVGIVLYQGGSTYFGERDIRVYGIGWLHGQDLGAGRLTLAL
jgi:adenine/guanine phosphoribosyltransferase-like PRPP-binding protein